MADDELGSCTRRGARCTMNVFCGWHQRVRGSFHATILMCTPSARSLIRKVGSANLEIQRDTAICCPGESATAGDAGLHLDRRCATRLIAIFPLWLVAIKLRRACRRGKSGAREWWIIDRFRKIASIAWSVPIGSTTAPSVRARAWATWGLDAPSGPRGARHSGSLGTVHLWVLLGVGETAHMMQSRR